MFILLVSWYNYNNIRDKTRRLFYMLEGKKAPTFRLPTINNKVVDLKDYRGQKVVLYFYPKDLTSG